MFALILSFLIFLKEQSRSVLHINLTVEKSWSQDSPKKSKQTNTLKIGNNLLLQYFSWGYFIDVFILKPWNKKKWSKDYYNSGEIKVILTILE